MADGLFPFQDVPGLLTPQESQNVRTQTMLSAAAGLLNASGPSFMPHSIFSDLGKGFAGGLQGYEGATKNALTLEALRQQTAMRGLQMKMLLQQFGLTNSLAQKYGLTSGQPDASVPAAAAGAPPAAAGAPASIPASGAPAAPPVPAAAGATGAPATGMPGLPAGVVAPALLGKLLGIPAIGDYAAKAAQPTDTEKDARDPQVAAYNLQQAQMKDDVTRYGKKYDSITNAGEQAADAQGSLQLTKAAMNDPNYYSGPMAETNLDYKRLLGATGLGDPNAAAPQEAFRNGIKTQILNTIKSLKGTGQIRVTEIRLIQQAMANADNSPNGNRTLVELADRLNQRALATDQAARNYKGGHLDAGFDTIARGIQNQPLLSPAEQKDIRLIAPPQFKSPQDMLNAGLPSGTPFKSPDGRILYAP